MMQPFDISELPERITDYRNEVLAEALSRNAQYLQQMWQDVTREEYVELWQELAQDAVNAMGSYMEPRVDGLEEGDDPRLVFYEHDGTEPIRSYVAAWIEGYATCALGGRCSEGEVRPMVQNLGVSLYPMDNRMAYAETILPQRGYNEECVSVAIGHAILSYMIGLSGDVPQEEMSRFNWMGDIDGFADGWRLAQRDGFGQDSESYVPYSEERQIDEFMQQMGAESAMDGTAYGDEPDMASGDDESPYGGQAAPDPSVAMGESLPEMYASVLALPPHGGSPVQDAGKTGIFIEVDEHAEDEGEAGDATGIIPASGDSAVFTMEDLDEFEDVTEEEVLRIKTKVAEESESSITGPLVSVVSRDTETEGHPEVKERTLRRLPPIFEKYLMLCVSNSLRGNASRMATLTEAGMTFEQSDRLRRKLMSATARYGLKELAMAGLDDGIPADEDGTEPVRTYANSWIQGYVSVITDGDYSQATIVRAAMMSLVGPADVAEDVEHVLERQEWEGYDDDCSMVTVAHLRVSLSSHSKGHPLAHPMEGSRKFSRRGATDGFSDGWWKAMEVVRRISEMAEAGEDVDLPTPSGEQAEQREPEPQSTSEIDKAKEEAKSLLAGLFVEDDLLSETSVSELIGAPMPVANPDRARHDERGDTGGDSGHPHGHPSAPEPQQMPVRWQTQPPAQPQQQAWQQQPQTPSSHQAPQPQPQWHPQPQAVPQQPMGPQPAPQPPDHSQQVVQQAKRERVRKHAEQCANQAVRANADLVRRIWEETGLQQDGASAWASAVMQATAAYGWHVANDIHANPAKSPDGTRPMLSYSMGWVAGYAGGSGQRELSDRQLQEISQRTGISFGEIGERLEYARGVCSSKGYGAECASATVRRVKAVYLSNDDRNTSMRSLPNADTCSWRSDIDGYADGWMIARRVRSQQEGGR